MATTPEVWKPKELYLMKETEPEIELVSLRTELLSDFLIILFDKGWQDEIQF